MKDLWSTKGDSVIYVGSRNDFEIVWKKKNAWKEITFALGIGIVSTQV